MVSLAFFKFRGQPFDIILFFGLAADGVYDYIQKLIVAVARQTADAEGLDNNCILALCKKLKKLKINAGDHFYKSDIGVKLGAELRLFKTFGLYILHEHPILECCYIGVVYA